MDRINKLADTVTASLQELLRRNVTPIISRLKAIEEWRAGLGEIKAEKGEPGENGKDADAQAITAGVLEKVMKALDAIPRPKDGDPGKDANPEFVREVVRSEVERAVASIPRPNDGEHGKSVDLVELSGAIMEAAGKAVAALPISPGKDADPRVIRAEVERAVAALPKPKDGESVHPDTVAVMVRVEMEKAVAALPKPEKGDDGKDVDMEVVRVLIAKAVAALPPPTPGRDGSDAVVDPLMIDAAVSKAMALVPKPENGEDGKNADPEMVAELVAKSVEKQMPGLLSREIERMMPELVAKAAMLVPPGRDGLSIRGNRGEDGTNGSDGLSLDDFNAEMKDGRTLVLKMRGADREFVREIVLEGMPIDRGVYQSGSKAKAGDGKTYGGSYWIAKQDTDESPTGPSNHWRLAVKGSR